MKMIGTRCFGKAELPYQDWIKVIEANFLRLYPDYEHNIMYEAPCVINNLTPTGQLAKRAPDLTIMGYQSSDVRSNFPILTKEVVRSNANADYSTESILDVFAAYPTLQESLLFDYNKKTWVRFVRRPNGVVRCQKRAIFSRVLRIKLSELTKYPKDLVLSPSFDRNKPWVK